MITLLGRVFYLGWIFFPFQHFKYTKSLPLGLQKLFFLEKSNDSFMGFPSMWLFFSWWLHNSLLIFNFAILNMVCLGVVLFGFIFFLNLYASSTWKFVSLFILVNFSAIISSDIFLITFSHSSFWDPYSANIGMLDVVPEVPQTLSCY